MTRYGLIKARLADWAQAIREANRLLSAGVPVHWVVSVSPGSGDGGEDDSPVQPGDFVIVGEKLPRAVGVEEMDAVAVRRVRTVKLSRPRIGLYGGGGAPFHHAAVFSDLGFELDFINDADIRAGALETVDVVVFPGGGWRAMAGQLDPLGTDGAMAVAAFVRSGGLYLGSCAGSFHPARVSESFAEACPAQRCLRMVRARVWNDGPAWGGLQSPGIGRILVENVGDGHPVMLGLPRRFPIVHYNGPFFVMDEEELPGASAARGLAACLGPAPEFTPAERFLTVQAGGSREREPGTLLIQEAAAAGAMAVVTSEYGAGWVLLCGSHPEFGDGLTFTEYTTAARILANAVLWQSARKPVWRTPTSRPSVSSTWPAAAPLTAAAAEALADQVERLRQRVRHLVAAVPLDGERVPAWLGSEYSLSMLGLTPAEIWKRTLEECTGLLDEASRRVERVVELYGRLKGSSGQEAEAVLRTVERWLWFRRADGWRQDGGFQGVETLFAEALRQLEAAADRLETKLPPPSGQPYDFLTENPYHLAVGSYLAASGNIANGLLLLRVVERELVRAVGEGYGQDRQGEEMG